MASFCNTLFNKFYITRCYNFLLKWPSPIFLWHQTFLGQILDFGYQKSPHFLQCIYIVFQKTKGMPCFGAAPATQPPGRLLRPGRQSCDNRFFHPVLQGQILNSFIRTCTSSSQMIDWVELNGVFKKSLNLQLFTIQHTFVAT